jgi:hypothetical protein
MHETHNGSYENGIALHEKRVQIVKTVKRGNQTPLHRTMKTHEHQRARLIQLLSKRSYVSASAYHGDRFARGARIREKRNVRGPSHGPGST